MELFDPGIEPASLTLACRFFTTEPPRKPWNYRWKQSDMGLAAFWCRWSETNLEEREKWEFQQSGYMKSRLQQKWAEPGWARMSFNNQARPYQHSYYPRGDLLEQAHFCYCTVWLLVLSFPLPSLKRQEPQHNGKGHLAGSQPSPDLSPALTLNQPAMRFVWVSSPFMPPTLLHKMGLVMLTSQTGICFTPTS